MYYKKEEGGGGGGRQERVQNKHATTKGGASGEGNYA
jgi:hypothetical protein